MASEEDSFSNQFHQRLFFIICFATGYMRVIPNGGPLISCVPCNCHNRSSTCDPQTGVCKNCRPGTVGSYCEKCIANVLEPKCDKCKPGYWGLYTKINGCQRKYIRSWLSLVSLRHLRADIDCGSCRIFNAESSIYKIDQT